MSRVRVLTVADADAGIRLDRWFARHVPELGHGRLEKLLRTGQIRVDGGRARSGQRVAAGQSVRVPPLPDRPAAEPRRPAGGDDALAADLAARVLYMDAEVLALDKPPGLPVQGGSGQVRHVDGALDGLRFGLAERPRLVHRLDKDTSGVLLLARTAAAAGWLARAFRHRAAEKTYWALIAGVIRPASGSIDLPIVKQPGRFGERMEVAREGGKRAITDYAVVEQLGQRVTWVAAWPRTGRTHQIRVHMAASAAPVLGDGKYGGAAAFLDAEGLSRKLHLHARAIRIACPDGACLKVWAPLPAHMDRSWRFFDFGRGHPEAGAGLAEGLSERGGRDYHNAAGGGVRERLCGGTSSR